MESSASSSTLWLQITSGRGPEECAWVVYHLAERLEEKAREQGLRSHRVHEEPGNSKETLRSVLMELEGEGVETWASSWVGTVQWIGRSLFRPTHKRNNWFVGVELLEPPPDVPSVQDKDLSVEVYRGSGPGGQHRNKVSTAIRITHQPTGIVVQAEEERSQTANRRRAMARLEQTLQARGEAQEKRASLQRWTQHNALERGNAVRVYRGEQFCLVRASEL